MAYAKPRKCSTEETLARTFSTTAPQAPAPALKVDSGWGTRDHSDMRRLAARTFRMTSWCGRCWLSALVAGGLWAASPAFMTLKGCGLMGDAVSHAVIWPGVVIAYGLKASLRARLLSFSGGGQVAVIGFVKQMTRTRKTR